MTYPNNANQYLPPVIQTPSALVITAITQSMPAVVTCVLNTDAANTYIPSQLVKLFIPPNYGMQQMANKTYKIIAVNGLNFSLAVDSTMFDPFVAPSSGEQPASISPSGSQNLQYNNGTNKLAFQGLNNNGN